MELRHLRYFIAVAENGSFGSTSRLLHVAQSAISEQIRDLEEELGVTLFDRKKRRIRLTAHGEQFLTDARSVISAAEKAIANARKSLHGELGTLTIGFFVGGAGSFFPPLIKEFRRRFPGVQVSLVEMAPGIQQQALQSGTIDVGFTRPLQPLQPHLMRYEHFQTEPLYAVLLKTHPLAQKRKIFMHELEDERFVLNERKYSPAVFDKVITLCAEAGFSPRIGTTASVASGVIALVEAGEGVAILPHGSSILGGDDVLFVPIGDAAARVDLVIAWSSQHDNPVVPSFLSLAREKRHKLKAKP